MSILSKPSHVFPWLILMVLIQAPGAHAAPLGPAPNTAPADNVVVFNEVLYHPRNNDPQLEWVELHNQMYVDVDLSNWSLEGAAQYRLPAGTVIPAGGYLVLAANPGLLRSNTGLDTVLGPWTGKLRNSGDTLTLRNHNGRLMDELAYQDGPPWPVGADGSGATLSKTRRLTPSGPAENWRASSEIGGTPGRVNFPGLEGAPPATPSLVSRSSDTRYHVPSASDDIEIWRQPQFDDSSWASGQASVGFDLSAPPNGTPTPVRCYLPLEGSLLDESGNALNGVASGSSFVYSTNAPPKLARKRSGDFNGSTTSVQISDPVDPDAYTISAWVRFETLRACSVVVRTDAGGPTASWSHQLRATAAGKFEHYVYDGGGQLITGSTIAVRSNWYHVAITARANGVMRLFVNGLQEGSDRPVGNLWAAGDQWRLGSNSGDGRNFMDGQISEFALWHQELTAPDIARLASGASPPLLNGLLGSYGSDVRVDLAGRNSSLWLRSSFQIAPGRAYDQLFLDVQYADGFVAWLNGEEIARRNAPETLAWNSAAPLDRALNDLLRTETIDLSNHIAALRPGSNVLAVQPMLRTAQDTQFLFTSRLRSREIPHDADRVSLVFHESPPAQETPFWIELYNYGDASLDLGDFHLLSSGGTEAPLPSRLIPAKGFAVLTTQDIRTTAHSGDRFDLLSGDGAELIDSIKLGGVLLGRTEASPRGEWAYPSAPTPGAANSFEWRDEIVINEIMYAAPPRFPLVSRPPVDSNTVILPFDASWKYNNTGADLGDSWKEPGYDDSAWPAGAAPLGTATGNLPLALKTPVPANGKTTFYFRTQFNVAAPPANATLQLTTVLDDGAIFYLNGQEARRVNMTNGAVGYLTKAASNVLGIRLSAPLALPIQALRQGLNTLAVEVHQAVTNGAADFILAARLHFSEESQPGIPGEPYVAGDEEWIELYNRSDHAVSLSGWRLADAVDFAFPGSAQIPSDGYLVVSRDAATLRQKFPGITIVGDYGGKLSRNSDRIRLLDPRLNVADEVRYYSDRPWPSAAHGGGSSLELRDPRADNSVAEAWAASDEGAGSTWQHYSMRGKAITPVYTPSTDLFKELRVCLLDAGEALIDNVSVVEDPGFTPRQLIQNSTFDAGLSKWRKMGTHIRSFADDDPDHPGNKVLHLVAEGAGSYLNNLIETTLKSGNSIVGVVPGKEYEISFDAKWISGSPMLRWELYYNQWVGTARLAQQPAHGTPGRRNSKFLANLGPTFHGLSHAPVVPRLRQPITVQVRADDPDGVASVDLYYSISAKPWLKQEMPLAADGYYRTALPGQSNAVQIQYYVAGLDGRGASSVYPPGGTNSRAYVKVESAALASRVPIIRALADPKEAQGLMPLTNLLSDLQLECTFIIDDKEIVYGGGIRLHGSMWSRQTQESTGFNVQFPEDHLYKGTRASVIFRRRDHGEILTRHMLANASNVPGNYDEFIYLVSPLIGNAGLARVIIGNDDSIWLKSQFEGHSAQVYKLEGIREFTTTDTGGAEGYKVAMPIGWIQEYDLQDQGDDKEQYRWTNLISNNRDQDDYTPFIAMAKVFGMSGTNLQQQAPNVMDIEEWSKVFGLQTLCGVVDVYTVENPHNLGYAVRPSDGRLLALQNDWSFYFQRGSSEPLIGAQNLSKIFSLPVYRRVFYGAILDLMNTTFNRAYAARWAQHYSFLAGEDYVQYLDYISQRSAFARTQFPKTFPFEILSNGGQPFSTNVAAITLQGRGWIDVYRITLGGASNEIGVHWIDAEKWETLIGLAPGTNDLAFTAYDRQGGVVGSDSVQIVADITERPQHDYLRISEIMYHPPPPTSAELEAGFADGEQFEFIELVNIGPVPVALKGVRFTVGVKFTFDGAAASQLAPGQRVLVVRNLAAFRTRYAGEHYIAGVYSGSLDNGGETLRFVDSLGAVIEEITYKDAGDWPYQADGDGASLERLSADVNANQPSNWQASPAWGGTPGGVASIPPSVSIAGFNKLGQLQLRLVIPGDGAYVLETKATLDPGPWQTLRALASSAAGRAEILSDTPSTGPGARYYRLRRP
ncbi:MAG: lamin tail domain-containing protein [Verrucomicrobia bacterium]|nr:lamin tail domain-containing protein [Verrucomicrobiota bacterium]MBI3869206.1 lamin tail domain-containing protein [Verrucomicrobiota bacterium]